MSLRENFTPNADQIRNGIAMLRQKLEYLYRKAEGEDLDDTDFDEADEVAQAELEEISGAFGLYSQPRPPQETLNTIVKAGGTNGMVMVTIEHGEITKIEAVPAEAKP